MRALYWWLLPLTLVGYWSKQSEECLLWKPQKTAPLFFTDDVVFLGFTTSCPSACSGAVCTQVWRAEMRFSSLRPWFLAGRWWIAPPRLGVICSHKSRSLYIKVRVSGKMVYGTDSWIGAVSPIMQASCGQEEGEPEANALNLTVPWASGMDWNSEIAHVSNQSVLLQKSGWAHP